LRLHHLKNSDNRIAYDLLRPDSDIINVNLGMSLVVMSYRDIITIEPDKRGGKPCIRRMRITVYDVLGWLAAGMSVAEIIDDFPELTATDIISCLEFAADRDHRLVALVSAN